MEQDTLKKILQRLNILISLELNPLYPEKSSSQDKIERLDSFNLKPSEIAEIIGSSSDKVSKQLYVIKGKKVKKDGSNRKES